MSDTDKRCGTCDFWATTLWSEDPRFKKCAKITNVRFEPMIPFAVDVRGNTATLLTPENFSCINWEKSDV